VWNENGAGNFKGVWHFNELAGWVAGGADYIKDSAGTNHGRAYNDVDAGEGMVDGGAAFGITFDEVDAPDSSSLRLTGNITLSAWVKPTGNGGSYPQIAGRDYVKEYSLRLWSNTRVPFISVKNTHVKATGSIAANAWSHVLVSYDGSNASFFINGVAAGTPALTAIPDGGYEIFRIGSRATSFPLTVT